MSSKNKTQFNCIMAHSQERLTLKKSEYLSGKVINKKVVNYHIGIAVESGTMEEVKHFRKRHYQGIYPDMDLDNDVLDDSALTLYTRDKDGQVNGTARLSIDGPYGFPQDRYLVEYREKDARLMELGRFIINKGNPSLIKDYYRAFYSVAKSLHCDAMVMSMQPHHIAFHQNRIGARVIAEDTESYGGPYSLACVVWEIEATFPKFFEWIGRGI